MDYKEYTNEPYLSTDKEKPEECEIVLAGACEKPLNPIYARYKRGHFYDISNGLVVFPTHWKKPNVPILI